MSGMSICRACSPASCMATASTAHTSRRMATASTRPSCWSIPTPRRSTGKLEWNDALFGYTIGDPYEDLTPDDRDSAPFMPRCVVIDSAFDWGDDRPPATPLHKSVIYELHVKGFTKLHPEVPEHAARHLRRPGHAGGDRIPAVAGRHGGRAAAGPPACRRSLPGRARAAQLLGLQHAGLLRARRALQQRRLARRAGARVQGHGQDAARRRDRSDPRRGLQPHRRGQPRWARRSRSAGSTTWSTTASRPATCAIIWTTPAAATA